jgi:transposase
MNLIHTAELTKDNQFDYLTEMQKHYKEVKSNPSKWIPWNYQETIDKVEDRRTSPPSM